MFARPSFPAAHDLQLAVVLLSGGEAEAVDTMQRGAETGVCTI